VDFRPTVERMAAYFLEKLNKRFAELDIMVLTVKVWETETSYAEAKGVNLKER